MIKVKHLTDRNLKNDIYYMSDDKREPIILKALKDGKYETVAEPMLGGTTTSILDECYRLTNSIDYPWFEHKGIGVSEKAEKGTRSTSIGDVIIVHGELFYVHNYGFKHIEV